MRIFRLFYMSRCVVQNHVGADNIAAEIADYAAQKNTKISITGAMTYDGNDFAQILEGEKNVVLELFEKIKFDIRHNCIRLVKTQDDVERHYTDWGMKHLSSLNYDELVKVMETA